MYLRLRHKIPTPHIIISASWYPRFIQVSFSHSIAWITPWPMNIRINSHTRRVNIQLPEWQAQCMHMPDTAIMPRWRRIFAAGFGCAWH